MPRAIVANGVPTQQVSCQTDTPQLAAIYARVSTKDQADKGYSLPTQLEACQGLAQREGYAVPDTHVFVEDYTGTSLNRPQLTRIRDLVQQGLVQAVIVHDMDRLARKLAHQLLLTDELDTAGVTLHVVTTPTTDRTPEAQMFTNMRGVIAEYERAKMLERTARGRKGRAQEGYAPHGRTTLGYVYVRHSGRGAHYEIDPEEAALVRRIFTLYTRDGLSQDALAALLTREGLPTAGERHPAQKRRLPSGTWHQSTIADILRNRTYIGIMHYGKRSRIPGKANPDKKTRWRAVPESEWIPVAVPPIVDIATFEAAHALMAQNKRTSKRNRKNDYLLTNGRLRCGQCGRAMVGETRPNRHPRYRCGKKGYHDLEGTHTARSVVQGEVDALVWTAVERVLNDPALISAELERRRDTTATQQDALDHERQQYERQLAQCDKEQGRWEAAYAAEVIDLQDFRARKTELDARRASAAQELARLDAEQDALTQTEVETATLRTYCAQVRERLHGFTIEEKHLAFGALDIQVTWHPARELEIRGSIPVQVENDSRR